MRFEITSELQQNLSSKKHLWRDKTAVVVMGDMLTLGSFCMSVSMELIGGYTTEQEGLNAIKTSPPNMLFVTEDLEQGYGISLIKEVKKISPTTSCMLFLKRETKEVVREALDAHCDGVIFCSTLGHGGYLDAMTAVANGSTYYPKEVKTAAGYTETILPELTGKELEVLGQLVLGMSNTEITESLYMSLDTVKTHMKNITSKLGVKSRTQAVITAIRAGM